MLVSLKPISAHHRWKKVFDNADQRNCTLKNGIDILLSYTVPKHTSASVAANKTMEREITPVILSVTGQPLTAPQLVPHPTEQGQENSNGPGLWIWSIQGKGSLCLHCHSVCFTNKQVIVTEWKLSPFLHILSKLSNLHTTWSSTFWPHCLIFGIINGIYVVLSWNHNSN